MSKEKVGSKSATRSVKRAQRDSPLHDFDRLLCRYVCENICSHLPKNLTIQDIPKIRASVSGVTPWHNRGGWGYKFPDCPPGHEFAYYVVHRVQPANLQDFILARGQPNMLFTCDELERLYTVFESEKPGLNRSWMPRKFTDEEFMQCAPEIQRLSWGETCQFISLSEKSATILDEGCSLHEGIYTVKEWIESIRYLLKFVHRKDLLPMPDGNQPTPSKFTAAQSALSPSVLKLIEKYRAQFQTTPESKSASINFLTKGRHREHACAALKSLKQTGEYLGSARRGRPRKITRIAQPTA